MSSYLAQFASILLKVNDGYKPAILKFSGAYPYLKQQILFHSDGPAIWHGSPDIRHI